MTTIQQLQQKALGIRIDAIRATTAAGSGHPTSCMSAADIVAALMFDAMRYDYANPGALTNDRFILSKGHAVPVFYAGLHQAGVITDEQLLSLRGVNSDLEGHPTPRFVYNEAATGSLGQGLSVGLGMALYARQQKLDYVTYVMLGDGECAEGSVWEAAELAGVNKTKQLVAIIDVNRLGQSGSSLDAHHTETYAAKFAAFGWQTIVIDGHDMQAIVMALETARQASGPVVIVAKTFKGYGLEEIQDKPGFHGKAFKPDEAQAAIAALIKRFGEPKKVQHIAISCAADQHKHITLTLPIKVFEGLVSTRKAFGLALADLAKQSDRIWALDADVKNSTYTELFETVATDRFIQCYIAEQNMVGVATGLTQRGAIAFAATFGAFFSRAFDQVRMAGIGRVPLRLCGSHSGVSIGQVGPSQMGLEDISMMRAVPGSVVLYPSDGICAYQLVYAMANYTDGLSYMKSTRADLPLLYTPEDTFVIGGSKVLRSSKQDQVCIIAAGITVYEALKAHDLLQKQGISVSIIDLYSIKPLDRATVVATARASNNTIITVEDHYLEGGLGEAVMAACSTEKFAIHQLGVREVMRSGSPEELMALAGIDAAAIVQKIRGVLQL